MKRMVWLVAAVLLVGGSQPAWAMRTKAHEAAESSQYGPKFFGMLGRGAINVVTCFVDPIVHIVKETKSGPPVVGTLTGVGKGLGCGVLRLGSGAVDIVTSWVPGFNGFPVSDSYDNCVAESVTSMSSEPYPSSYSQPASAWDVPTTEPGAAQAPIATEPEPAPAPKKTWKK